MSDIKKEKQQRVNFTQEELKLVKSLVVKRPIIEKKVHDKKTENLRKSAWKEIHDEFNAEGLNIKRNIDQLKGAWKRVKLEYKSKKAAERRSKFRTGGGPPSPAAEEDQEMDEMFVDQKPLDNIPDDDDDNDYDVDDPDAVPMGSRAATPNVDSSTSGLSTATCSGVATPSVQPPVVSQKKTINKVTSFAEKFHDQKMEYLKLEHELKMKVLEEEKSYWALMKANAQRCLTPEGNKSGGTSEAKTFQLLGHSIQHN